MGTAADANTPRIGRVLMATGRDATDCTITTSFGHTSLTKFVVTTGEVKKPDRQRSFNVRDTGRIQDISDRDRARYYELHPSLSSHPWERSMEPIEIPVATLPIKLVMGPACLLVVFAVLSWGFPKFRTFLRVVSGREPRKPGTKNIHLALGFIVYALVFSPALIAGGIFIQIMTTPPAIVSDEGVAGGGGWLYSRKTIAWDEVQRLDCDLRHADRSVTRLRIVATNKRIELAGGSDLTDVRDYIWARVPHNAVRPCSVPFPS